MSTDSGVALSPIPSSSHGGRLPPPSPPRSTLPSSSATAPTSPSIRSSGAASYFPTLRSSPTSPSGKEGPSKPEAPPSPRRHTGGVLLSRVRQQTSSSRGPSRGSSGVYDLMSASSDGLVGKEREVEGGESSPALEELLGVNSVGSGGGVLGNDHEERGEGKRGFEGSNNSARYYHLSSSRGRNGDPNLPYSTSSSAFHSPSYGHRNISLPPDPSLPSSSRSSSQSRHVPSSSSLPLGPDSSHVSGGHPSSFGTLSGTSPHLVILTPTTQEWKDIKSKSRIELRSLSGGSRGRPSVNGEEGSESEESSDPFSDEEDDEDADEDAEGGILKWSIKRHLPPRPPTPPTRSFSRTDSAMSHTSSSGGFPPAFADLPSLTRTVTADPLVSYDASEAVDFPHPSRSTSSQDVLADDDLLSHSFYEPTSQPAFDRSFSSSWKQTGLFASSPPAHPSSGGIPSLGTWPRRKETSRSGYLDIKSEPNSTDEEEDDLSTMSADDDDEDSLAAKSKRLKAARQTARTSGQRPTAALGWGVSQIGSFGFGSMGLGSFGNGNGNGLGGNGDTAKAADDSRSNSNSSPESPLETPINLHPPTPEAHHPSTSPPFARPASPSSTSSSSRNHHPRKSTGRSTGPYPFSHHHPLPPRSTSPSEPSSSSPLNHLSTPPLSPRIARRRQSQKSQRLSSLAGRNLPSPFASTNGLAGLSPFSPFSAFPAVDLTSVGGGGYFGTGPNEDGGSVAAAAAATREREREEQLLKKKGSHPSMRVPPYLMEGNRMDSTTSILSLAPSTGPPSHPGTPIGTPVGGRGKSIDDYVITSEAGRGAYGLVKRARHRGPLGEPVGDEVIIKMIIKQRILADSWKKHRHFGPIPIELHIMDQLSKFRYVPPPNGRPWDPERSSRRSTDSPSQEPASSLTPKELTPKGEDTPDPTARGTSVDSLSRRAEELHGQGGLGGGVNEHGEVYVRGHPNVCTILDSFEDREFYFLVMPRYGTGQDLFDRVESLPSGLPAPEVRSLLGQIVDGLAFLHSQGIVHRDIKDENVILDGSGHAQLIDFGSAAHWKKGKVFDTFSGTLDAASPEILRGERYGGKEQDIWAVGVVGYVLLCGETPFVSSEEAMVGFEEGTSALAGLRERCWEDGQGDEEGKGKEEGKEEDGGGALGDAIDFVLRCCEKALEDRPTAVNLLEHRFLVGNTDNAWVGHKGWLPTSDAA